MIRNDLRIIAPHPRRVARENDILVIEAEPESLASIISRLGLKLEEETKPATGREEKRRDGGKKDGRQAGKCRQQEKEKRR